MLPLQFKRQSIVTIESFGVTNLIDDNPLAKWAIQCVTAELPAGKD